MYFYFKIGFSSLLLMMPFMFFLLKKYKKIVTSYIFLKKSY